MCQLRRFPLKKTVRFESELLLHVRPFEVAHKVSACLRASGVGSVPCSLSSAHTFSLPQKLRPSWHDIFAYVSHISCRLFSSLSRAFSGTVISHDLFVVLDVMWLAGVLKPILDHRGITKNEMGDQVREACAHSSTQIDCAPGILTSNKCWSRVDFSTTA